jgi:HNH endonuclease
MTLVLPREDEVRALAHSLYRKRCVELGYEEHGFDVQDWVMAERAATFHKNFERVNVHQFVTKEKQYLGAEETRVCRFCRRDAGTTTFKKVAHAVPQLLGNRSVIAYYECDACNTYFSEDLEDHLGKMLNGVRTLLGLACLDG